MKPTIKMLAIVLAFSTLIVAQGKATVSTKYITAAEALAADDYAKAKTALTGLANESQGDLKLKAQAAAGAANIAEMRKAFKPLSEVVSKMDLPAGHSLLFCPMYEKGSYWVQKKGTTANPYFGKAMLTCGEVKK
jgi:membrane fusion protein, copper/silver efflux system